jgi:hypothetical protein
LVYAFVVHGAADLTTQLTSRNGSKPKYLHTANLKVSRHISSSLVLDEGDFREGWISLESVGPIRRWIIGDYRLRPGDGLCGTRRFCGTLLGFRFGRLYPVLFLFQDRDPGFGGEVRYASKEVGLDAFLLKEGTSYEILTLHAKVKRRGVFASCAILRSPKEVDGLKIRASFRKGEVKLKGAFKLIQGGAWQFGGGEAQSVFSCGVQWTKRGWAKLNLDFSGTRAETPRIKRSMAITSKVSWVRVCVRRREEVQWSDEGGSKKERLEMGLFMSLSPLSNASLHLQFRSYQDTLHGFSPRGQYLSAKWRYNPRPAVRLSAGFSYSDRDLREFGHNFTRFYIKTFAQLSEDFGLEIRYEKVSYKHSQTQGLQISTKFKW